MGRIKLQFKSSLVCGEKEKGIFSRSAAAFNLIGGHGRNEHQFSSRFEFRLTLDWPHAAGVDGTIIRTWAVT